MNDDKLKRLQTDLITTLNNTQALVVSIEELTHYLTNKASKELLLIKEAMNDAFTKVSNNLKPKNYQAFILSVEQINTMAEDIIEKCTSYLHIA
jgi:hypothetical protein